MVVIVVEVMQVAEVAVELVVDRCTGDTIDGSEETMTVYSS